MRVDVISDTVCPWCFIGKRRLERALAQRPGLDVEVVWHPFQLNPDMPDSGLDRTTYLSLKFGGEARAREIYQAIRRAGTSEGLDFRFDLIAMTPNTVHSHRLARYAQQHGNQDAAIEAMFRAYFLEGRDIGSSESLIEIGAQAGLDSAPLSHYLQSDDDVEVVRREDLNARRIGVTGVPCFIINGRYAISGAQEPEVFLQVFTVAEQVETDPEPVPSGLPNWAGRL